MNSNPAQLDAPQLPIAPQATKIAQKWGFGLAVVKPEVQALRVAAAELVLELIANPASVHGRQAEASAALSEVKGLFNRVHRADQWDWCTVWLQLGRPGTKRRCSRTAQALSALRKALERFEPQAATEAIHSFVAAGGRQALEMFLAPDRPQPEDAGLGYVYVLSTREQRRMLKIGYTDGNVVDRVNAINRATGIVVPFGVCAVWVVKDAHNCESLVHGLLNEYRVRPDREFFELDFFDARRIIDEFVRSRRLES